MFIPIEGVPLFEEFPVSVMLPARMQVVSTRPLVPLEDASEIGVAVRQVAGVPVVIPKCLLPHPVGHRLRHP